MKDDNRKPTASADFPARAVAAGEPANTKPVFTLVAESAKQAHYRDQFGHDYFIGKRASVTFETKAAAARARKAGY